ncbi:MAG: hypothetical protein AB7F53_08590 [Nitrososphaeraceae archaeon]
MHKSVILAVVSLLFVASPLVMFGTSLQTSSGNQYSGLQTTDYSSQNTIQTIPVSQEQMQQQQFENLQLMSIDKQNQNNESQITIQPQQDELKELSIITQEKMQQQQYENFKQLMESVRDNQIQVTQD